MSTTLMSSDPIALGRRLRRVRDQAGVSMALAARRAGMTRSELEHLERGRAETTLETLATLARLCGCPLEYVITGQGPSTYDAWATSEAVSA